MRQFFFFLLLTSVLTAGAQTTADARNRVAEIKKMYAGVAESQKYRKETELPPNEMVIRNDKRRIICEAIDRLPKREAITIRCLFGLTDDDKSYTLVETAQILSKLGIDGPKGKPMSKQHICNIRDTALAKLKETLAGIELD